MNNSIQGQCLCGEVRFHYETPALWCGHCHCTLCQRAHGAPLVTWVGVDETRFHFERNDSLRWYESTPGAQRGFCSDCGSTLFFQSKRWPGEMHVSRPNLQEDIDLEPRGHVHRDSQAPWFPFEDHLASATEES